MTTATISRKSANAADLEAILATVEDLPTIPETLIKILNVIDDPKSGASDLASVVRRDAPLMANILKLANSPYYGARGNIGDINRCVAVLGYRTVRQVAVCVSVATVLVKGTAESKDVLDYRELWRHSVVTGAIAKHLARITGHSDPEAIFTAGLLHDVGKFILELHAPGEYAGVIRSSSEQQIALIDAEYDAFGFDHAQLGEAFATSWRFPAVLVRTFGSHHDSASDSGQDNPYWQDTALVSLADYLANTIAPSRSDLGFNPKMFNVKALHLAANVTVETVEDNLEAIRQAIENASSYLNIT